ncbi:MAG: hypothetical protein LBH30_06220 [Prevotellaceae bacterium]|jgi:hypothetical protein|nr:hypothetical protein [Prevotellaceae bacterium]
MKRIQAHKKLFLYLGLGILALAFAVKFIGAPAYCFWILLIAAIMLKIGFLISVCFAKEFRPSVWLYLILAGVALILTSMLFKTIFPMPVLRGILFYGAILLKITGLFLMIFKDKR